MKNTTGINNIDSTIFSNEYKEYTELWTLSAFENFNPVGTCLDHGMELRIHRQIYGGSYLFPSHGCYGREWTRMVTTAPIHVFFYIFAQFFSRAWANFGSLELQDHLIHDWCCFFWKMFKFARLTNLEMLPQRTKFLCQLDENSKLKPVSCLFLKRPTSSSMVIEPL